ncbi:gamma-interferon-inducible lysosomal thiol reductase-like [Dermacentor variabilis]|uniref:gamma-interferon-inducible lysosomal thiol reductase-like n=1 Tax=Dermacentor variabilis TaxID=34621 RepID=UPI003F5B1051
MAPRSRGKGGGVGVAVRSSQLLLWLVVLSAVFVRGRALRGITGRRRVDFSQIPKTARIQVYYESLCPYSIAFITEQLWPTYVRVGYLMDVQLVPFGNAFKEQQQQNPYVNRQFGATQLRCTCDDIYKVHVVAVVGLNCGVLRAKADCISSFVRFSVHNFREQLRSARAERFALGRRQEPEYKYSCQHGPDECFGNVVQSCAASIFNDTILSLAFVTCMSLAEHPNEAGKECARGIARNWNAIQRCANGGKGRALQDEMSERTWNLDPPHHYVPWIVINGVHNDEQQSMAQTDLLQVVCDATPDGRKPPPCFADLEDRRSLQKLSASIEEHAEDAPNGSSQRARPPVVGHSLKEIQD